MHSLILPALGAAALVRAQVQAPDPPPTTLTSTQSGVVPVAPTPFPGFETNEGALVYGGPPNPGFVGTNGPATPQTNLPTTTYQAVLPEVAFNPFTGTTISGSITAVGTAGGVQFTVNLTGFPDAAYGPFPYHIHTLPVPADGNCSAALGHLDPTNRGELYACDVANPQTCQAGDLSGKHGNVTTQSFTASYLDPYLTTVPGSPYFFGDKSFVIHTKNATRLTCANFVLVGGANGTSNGTAPSPTPYNPTAPTVTPFAGAASHVSTGIFGVVAAGIAAFLAL